MIRKSNRFHGHRAVSRVRGKVLHGPNTSFRYALNNLTDYRLAIVVSKKTAPHAVTRNRIRRRLFELARTQGLLNSKPLDIVVYVKTADLASIDTKELATEFERLTIKILKQSSPATPTPVV